MKPLYLLDTSVLSELAPGRRPVPEKVVEWLEARDELSHISVITLLEFERGVAKLLRQGHSSRARAISSWIDTLLARYARRIIDINQVTAQYAGQLEDRAIGKGYTPGLADALIAATAIAHDGMVLTRNLRHFEQLGVECMDPFSLAP